MTIFFFLLGITIYFAYDRYLKYGLANALAYFFGVMAIILSNLPWWAALGMAIWLAVIINGDNWKKPEPKISDTK